MTRMQSFTRPVVLGALLLIPVLCFAPSQTAASKVVRRTSVAAPPTRRRQTRPPWQQAAGKSNSDKKLSPRTAQLQASETTNDESSSSSSSFKLPCLDKETRTSILSAASFIVMDVFFRRLFLRLRIDFPSSLGGCGVLFAALLALPSDQAQKVYSKISPGAAVLAKWLPIFFVPSLITLPLAQSMGSAVELVKIGAVTVGGFLFTLLTASASVVGVRKLIGGAASSEETTSAGEVTIPEPVKEVVATAAEVAAEAEAKPAPKAFSDETFNALTVLTAVSGLLASVTTVTGKTAAAGPLSALFFLGATLQSFVFGARLPKAITKSIHPLVICTMLSWATMGAFGALFGGHSFRSFLKSYRTAGPLSPLTSGPGDLLLFMLGPAVLSLAVSMYDRRKLMQENLGEVGTAVGVSTLGGVFGTALAVRLFAIANPSIRLGLLSRNITSPLAMAIAGILGADVSLAVSFVVVTGLLGANFGAAILDAVGIQDAVARGLGMGAAAHGLGTAAIANEKDAFPFAAIGMALTASAATVTVSIPFLKRIIVQLALGG